METKIEDWAADMREQIKSDKEKRDIGRGYPDHYQFKQNSLIALDKANHECILCHAPVKIVHHLDLSKDNHELENLVPLCSKCHSYVHRRGAKKTSKYIREYGYTLKQLGLIMGRPKEGLYSSMKTDEGKQAVKDQVSIFEKYIE